MDKSAPDPAAISNLLIVAGALMVAVAMAGVAGLVWRPLGGLFVGLLAAGVETVVLGFAAAHAAATSADDHEARPQPEPSANVANPLRSAA